jgi:hypothetical protein
VYDALKNNFLKVLVQVVCMQQLCHPFTVTVAAAMCPFLILQTLIYGFSTDSEGTSLLEVLLQVKGLHARGCVRYTHCV